MAVSLYLDLNCYGIFANMECNRHRQRHGHSPPLQRCSQTSRPKSRRFAAVGLETRLRAQPLAREAMAQSSGDGWFGAMGVERAGAQCAPLHTVCRQARRHLRHRASEMTIKLRGQVVARLAERQRMFIAGLKTGGGLGIPLSVRELLPPQWGCRGWMSAGCRGGVAAYGS